MFYLTTPMLRLYICNFEKLKYEMNHKGIGLKGFIPWWGIPSDNQNSIKTHR